MSKLARSLASRPAVSRPAYVNGTSNAVSGVGRQELGEREIVRVDDCFHV